MHFFNVEGNIFKEARTLTLSNSMNEMFRLYQSMYNITVTVPHFLIDVLTENIFDFKLNLKSCRHKCLPGLC